MRIALLMQLAPRKLGSFERWLMALAEEARRRGHHLDLFRMDPIHPVVRGALAELQVGDHLLSDLPPGRASVARLSGYDVLHLNLLAPRGRYALMAAAAWPARVVFVDHTSGELSPHRSLLSRWADKVTFFRTARVLGVSRFVTERDRRRFALPVSRTGTVYNGVRVPPARPARPSGPLRILAAAYLIPEKGVHHLVRAVSRLRHPFHLQLVGDGPEAPALRALVSDLGLEPRVELLGLRDDVPELMARADVFVHPCRWAEAFGLTVAEAMAAGCAVVASNIGAMPELLSHGRTGLLVEPGDEDQLAQALDRLARSPEERERLGIAAWREAQARFSLEGCVRAHLAACEGCLDLSPLGSILPAPAGASS